MKTIQTKQVFLLKTLDGSVINQIDLKTEKLEN